MKTSNIYEILENDDNSLDDEFQAIKSTSENITKLTKNDRPFYSKAINSKIPIKKVKNHTTKSIESAKKKVKNLRNCDKTQVLQIIDDLANELRNINLRLTVGQDFSLLY
jgi:hypothetical protein